MTVNSEDPHIKRNRIRTTLVIRAHNSVILLPGLQAVQYLQSAKDCYLCWTFPGFNLAETFTRRNTHKVLLRCHLLSCFCLLSNTKIFWQLFPYKSNLNWPVNHLCIDHKGCILLTDNWQKNTEFYTDFLMCCLTLKWLWRLVLRRGQSL